MDIRSTLDKLCAAFNAHDLDRIMAFFADDCVLQMPRGNKPWGSRFEGKQNVREGLATRFAGLPDVHYGDAEHFVDSAADTGMSKWTLTGTTLRREEAGGPWLRLLYVSRRQGDRQGLVLENRGVGIRSPDRSRTA
jgi:ketosteroid isomerase-like protein